MSGKTESVVEEIVAKVRTSVEKALAGAGRELDAIEEGALEVGRMAARLTLQALANGLGSGHVGPVHRGRDQVVRHFSRHGEREFQTLAGPVTLRRAYYLDPCGVGGGLFPLDEELGLGSAKLSPKLERAICELGAWVPFERVPGLLERLLGWATSEQTARRTTERLGERVAERSRREAGAFREAPKSFSAERKSDRIAVAVDGTMAHMGGEWREAKVGAIFAFNHEGEQIASSKRYVARFGDPSTLGDILSLEAHRAGVAGACEVVALGDGAPWIWNLMAEHFPQATCVLDYFHVMEHVSAVASARFGANERARRSWTRMVEARLMRDDAAWLIAQVERAAKRAGPPPKGAHDEHPRVVLARNVEYFKTNRERMLYGTFRSRGLPIGSGVVEAACKNVVQQRMKGAGMRWGDRGGPAILAARVAVLNGDLQRCLERLPLAA